jgi:hypothetical protein
VPQPNSLDDSELEPIYLDKDFGRQILHVTFGSVLTSRIGNVYQFRDKIKMILSQNEQMHENVLKKHLGKHLKMLLAG